MSETPDWCVACGAYIEDEMALVPRHPRYPALCVECGDDMDADLTPEQLQADQRLRETVRGVPPQENGDG
jgi:hypothetical protein